MKARKRYFLNKMLVFPMLFLIPVLLPAQNQAWSLERCILHARENNLTVKKQFLNVQLAKTDNQQNKYGLLPSLNASASHVYNWGQTIDMYTNQFATERVQSNNFYLSTSVVLFNGFQKLNGIRQSQIDLQMSQLDVERTINDISLNVTTFYLQVLFYKELVKVGENQLDISRQQAERTAKLVNAGTLAQGELLNMEAQVASDELTLIESRNNYDISLLTLSQLLDLNNEPGFVIETPELGILADKINASGPSDIYAFAVKNQPEILSSELRVRSSEKSLDIAKGAFSPTLSLNGSIGTGYSGASRQINPDIPSSVYMYPTGITQISQDTVLGYGLKNEYRTKPFWDQITDNENKSLGFYLSIPIFNGMRTRTNISRSKISLENARLDLQIAKNNLNKVIQQSHFDALASLKRYQAAQKKVSAQQESFHYAEQKYNVGLMTSVEYNQNKKDLAKAASDLLQAKYDFLFKTKILDFYQGKPLTLK
ncbi:MAG: TolC family protein [Bacteroidales bacterium]|jgi:outer membrane protein|nr:TolC family protein [Bacteroidales bacterium]